MPLFRRLLTASFALAWCALAAAQSAPAPVKPVPPSPSAAASADPAPAGPVKAQRNPELYQAVVTLTSQGAAERQAATAKALGQVIVKLTGNPQAPLNTVVRRAMATAPSLVVASTDEAAPSDSEGNTAIGDLPIFKTNLNLSFNPDAVDALIAAAGLKYWTGDRPRPIIWLAIDDGRGARLVSSQQLNVVRPLAQRGLDRGVHFLLPTGTAVEQAAVGSIWNLDAAALLPLNARYGNDTLLIGKVYRSVSGWSAWWVLNQGGVELARWPMTLADPRQVIASGADGVAEALAKRDATWLSTGTAGIYAIDVVGIGDSKDFVRAMSYLEQLPVVRRVSVSQADPDRLRLQLDLAIGLKGFDSLVSTGDVLEAASSDGTPAPAGSLATPRYRLKADSQGDRTTEQ